MLVANRFTIDRQTDHFVVRFGVSTSSTDPQDPGDEVATIMLPLTSAAHFTLEMFEGVLRSTQDIGKFYADLQVRMAKLNALSESLKTPAANP